MLMLVGKPRFPIDTIEKVEVEGCLDWLLTEFGFNQTASINQLTVKSPAVQNGLQLNDCPIFAVFEFVKRQFPFDTSQYQLQIVEVDPKTETDSRLNLPGPNDIFVCASHASHLELEFLVAEIACQLSRRHVATLVGENESDWVSRCSDFLPVLFGLGVFCANSSLSSAGNNVAEQTQRCFPGLRSYPARFYGVAMACLAFRSGSAAKNWKSALRPDAKIALQKALKYYQKTDDCLMMAEPLQQVFRNRDVYQVVRLLESASASTIIAALGMLRPHFQEPSEHPLEVKRQLKSMLNRFLDHQDWGVRLQAVGFCRLFKEVDTETIDCLKRLLVDQEQAGIRKEALRSLVQLAIPGRLSLTDVRSLLSDHDLRVADWAAMAVMQIDTKDDGAVHEVLPTIRRAINSGEWETAVHLCEALKSLTDDWLEKLDSYLIDSPIQLAELKIGIKEWQQYQ